MRRAIGLLWISFGVSFAACGGSVSSDTTQDQDTGPSVVLDSDGHESAGDDSGSPPDDSIVVTDAPVDGPDHGAPSDVYPAFPPDLPQLQFNGGPTLTSPVVVTVTFAGEPEADTLEAFGDAIGKSAFWSAAVGEYGIGPATSGPSNHVRIPGTPPSTMSQRDLRTFVATNATSGAWPAPTPDTVYMVYTSSSTTITTFGGAEIC